MKRKSMRVLAMVLAFVMLVSASCVSAFAYKSPYTGETNLNTDENGKYYFTYEQGATYVIDLLEELVHGINNGLDMPLNFKILFVNVDLGTLKFTSLEDFGNSVYNTYDKVDGFKDYIGDFQYLNGSALQNFPSRNNTTYSDAESLYRLIKFLYDNRTFLQKLVDQSINFGLADSLIKGKLPEVMLQIPDLLANLAYTKLEDLTGKEKGASGSGTTATTYDPDGKDVERSVNDILLWLFNTKIPELVNFDGTLGLTMSDINITSVSLYDMVHNVIQAALDNLVVPLLTKVLLDAFNIETSEAYPYGTEDQMNNETMTMVIGIVEGLLITDETPEEDKPNYSGCQYPGQKIETLLTWFFQGGMDQFIGLTTDGLEIKDAFVELLYKVARIGIPMLAGMGFGTLPKDMIHAEELNTKVNGEYVISDSQCIAILINMLFSNILQGYYCNPKAQTLPQIGAYCLASLCARILPDYNYMEQLEANWEPNHQITGIDGNTITALPFTDTYTVNGQIPNGNGGFTARSKTYTIPYACVDMGVTVGVYFLDGLITADFDEVPLPNGSNATERFEAFVKVLLDWVVDHYLPVFKDTYNLDTAYPNASYVWKEIDEILFGLLPTSWLPSSITDHTPGGVTNDGTIELKMSGDLICGWLLGSVMDVDVQQLVSLLQRNKSSDAELAKPTLTVLLRLIDRVLYIALGKYAILPANQGSRNAYGTATTITRLNQVDNGLLKNTNLGQLVYYLITGLSGGASYDLNKRAVPLLRTLLPLLLSTDFVKPYRDSVLSVGQIKVSDLRSLIETIKGQGGVTIPYGVADVDDTTTGTYYYVDENYNVQTATLPAGYVDGRTYYSEQYIIAQNVDKFTASASYNHGTGLYGLGYSYAPVTLNGSNYDPKATYCSTEFEQATGITEKTNGTYFTAQNASSAVTLPDDYAANTVYYTHPEVALGASATGNYLVRTNTYTAVNLNGLGGGFNENKTYYKKAFSDVSFGYMDAYNPSTGRIAMGVYNSSGGQHGVGTYQSSISGQQFMVFRNQEDFPDALYTFNNFNDFIEDAEKFIGKYEDFLADMKEAADDWKADDPSGDGISTIYPWFTSNGQYDGRPAQYGVNAGDFNNLQAIVDFRAIYGDSAFITGNGNKPLDILPHSDDAGTTKRQVTIYKQWNKYVKAVVDYSNKLNNYYDGINYYLSTAEMSRKSFSNTVVYSLRWLMEKLCATAWNGGVNGYVDELTGNLVPTYTEKSWNNFVAAYQCAVDVLAQVQLNQASAKTTQSMITAVRSGLIKAFYALTKAGDLADKVQLYNAIVIARRTLADPNLADTYTQASIDTLTSVLANATALFEAVVEADEQNTVDSLTARLNAAITNLVYLVAPGLEIPEGSDIGFEIPEEQGYVINSIQYGFIYGIAEGAGLVLDPSMISGINPDFVKVISQTYGNGTGSYIQAKDSGDTVKFIYYAVLFGDVNGDARIDSTDKAYIQAYTIGAANTSLLDPTTNGGSYNKAADVDNDGSITASDAAAIGQVVNYEATIKQDATVVGSRIQLA